VHRSASRTDLGPEGLDKAVTEQRDSLVERILVVVAHPDDAGFWLGGTIAGWTARKEISS
jgi:hypothetical protein